MTGLLEEATLDAPEDDWRQYGACRDTDKALFFPTPIQVDMKDEPPSTNDDPWPDTEDEPPYPSPEVKAICMRCPVASQCLQYALDNRVEFGIYGGMSGYQRSLLLKPLTRRRCPGCGSDETEIISRNQICVACGISWDRSLSNITDDTENTA
jgi:WhiB family transcriptional regulator, redox-sensing transcriptional regulator